MTTTVNGFDSFGEPDDTDDEVTDDELKFLLRVLAERLDMRFGIGGWKIFRHHSTLFVSGRGPAIVGE